MDNSSLPFALLFSPDAYSMAGKIMGRNAAGFNLLKAAASYVGGNILHGAGPNPAGEAALRESLRSFGSNAPVAWHSLHRAESLAGVGALYYPAPVPSAMAHLRNRIRPSAYSCFGVTHTLSSEGAMSLLSAMALPPFKPWDALVCTSRVTRDVFGILRDRTREALRRETGASRFPDIQTPIIPLGVVTRDFAPDEALRAEARQKLGFREQDVVILSLGRLTFHAKYNPAPLYQALEALPKADRSRVALVECGVYPNEGIAKAYQAAQKTLMPSVRCMKADGADAPLRAALWQAADIFVSLSDNIQESFGLAPIEAMAAGVPVVATDWDGYRDSVRHGVDGFLVPTLSARPGTGDDLALRHAAGADTYDMYIGRASLATACDPHALSKSLGALVADRALRRRMGAAGRERALARYDWAHVLSAYADLCGTLAELRQKAAQDGPEPWPDRPDPFALFATYPSRQLDPADRISVSAGASDRLGKVLGLTMANYCFLPDTLPVPLVKSLFAMAGKQTSWGLAELLAAGEGDPILSERALLWLAKFDLIRVTPRDGVPDAV